MGLTGKNVQKNSHLSMMHVRFIAIPTGTKWKTFGKFLFLLLDVLKIMTPASQIDMTQPYKNQLSSITSALYSVFTNCGLKRKTVLYFYKIIWGLLRHCSTSPAELQMLSFGINTTDTDRYHSSCSRLFLYFMSLR